MYVIKMASAAAFAATVLSVGAVAQTRTPPPPPKGPTVVQCNQGYKEGMGWTRQQFTQACRKLKRSNIGR